MPSEFLKTLDGQQGVFTPTCFVRLFQGRANPARMLAQLLYWYERNDYQPFFMKCETLEQQTGIGEKGQRSARRVLKELGIISEQRKGVPSKIYFTIHLDVLEDLLSPFLSQPSIKQVSKDSLKTVSQPAIEQPTSPAIRKATALDRMEGFHNKEDKITYKITEETTGAKESAEKPYVQSSEDRFAEEMRQRANGTYSSPFSPEKSEQLHHLQKTIGTQNANHRQVKENWQRWYSEFSREFVETAWQLSKGVSIRTGKKRLWTFIDLFEDFGQYPQLKQHVRIDDESLNVPRLRNFSRADELYSEGEQVFFEDKLYTIFAADETFLELQDADGNFAHNIFPKWVQPAHTALAGD